MIYQYNTHEDASLCSE